MPMSLTCLDLLPLATGSFTYLNAISLLGLVAMLLLAWAMGSDRSKVNWRLVTVGIVMQLVIAAVLFNSQSWTFPRVYTELNSLAAVNEWVQQQPELSGTLDHYISGMSGADAEPDSLTDLNRAIAAGDLNPAVVDEWIEEHPPMLPRFSRGVLFYGVDQFFNAIRRYVEAGTRFVFELHPRPGDSHDPLLLLKCFACGVIPTVIFFGSLMSVLYYLGIMRWVVEAMARVMQRLLGTSGAESLAAAANVMIGQTEAPLVIKPFVGRMTRSELNCLMVGGFATITGSLMAVFASMGISAGHLLTASIISAPAALVIAKILQPETGKPDTLGTVQMPRQNDCVNVIDAAAQGASDGMKLVINVIAMLIAFLALIALLDSILGGLGELAQWVYNALAGAESPIDLEWSIGGTFAVLFYPLAWIMGIASEDCLKSGQILGTKMVVNEFVAYLDLGQVVQQMAEQGTAAPTRLSERTQVILTYALCGFSNFSSIGIQIGGIGAIAPERRSDLAQLGLRAMLGGMLACCMTACVAGLLYGVL